MMYRVISRSGLLLLLICFPVFTLTAPALEAKIIETQRVLSPVNESDRTVVDSFLTRAEVEKLMVDMGVDPEEAKGRVAALNEQELQLLQQRISDLPAGADALAVMGAVFLVLLILELVGVTHVFSNF